jgi:hypothetical protein
MLGLAAQSRRANADGCIEVDAGEEFQSTRNGRRNALKRLDAGNLVLEDVAHPEDRKALQLKAKTLVLMAEKYEPVWELAGHANLHQSPAFRNVDTRPLADGVVATVVRGAGSAAHGWPQSKVGHSLRRETPESLSNSPARLDGTSPARFQSDRDAFVTPIAFCTAALPPAFS